MTSEQETSSTALEGVVSAFIVLRPRLFGIAHRIVRNRTETEDVLQDVWVRWQNTDRVRVLDPPAFLVQVTTRVALNVVQSARVRRETSVGLRPAEQAEINSDPALGVERAEALELALALLLEKLNSTERAAYVLREAFAYPYSRIADDLQLSQVNTRQIVSRARKRLTAERREPVDSTKQKRFLEAFVTAAQSGDMDALKTLLVTDAAPPSAAPARKSSRRTDRAARPPRARP
ncbi:sigma-70 family RNA polymerase sigma factor [Streptomyces sp. NPDC018964]|uniref:sigma-70 family RNA polymerase sigma factor n=1 Tax=Streptomyces sp. NPDC018964 TaxID=3365058 RepID=UPI00379A66F4